MDYQGDNLRDFFQTNGRKVLQRAENNYSLKYFTENEIRNITDGYKSVLGRGAFGEVYKGTLEDQSSVAVKRYIHGTHKEVFAKEVIVHSQINHKNVVRLLGCCTEENALMIVMEFISNGNLDSILHGNRGNGRVPFPLKKRIEIAIEVAEVLWCMHSMYSPVLHGDIKPANILLDENFQPKISDFGIARLLSANGPQQATTVIGSIGYLDPAYCESGILTPKSDVYSFGVVLLEIITRNKAVDGTVTLAQSFNEALTKGEDVQHMFDEEISVAENKKFLRRIGQLAAKCLQRDVKTRPEMVEVANSLRMIRKAMQRDQDEDVLLAAYQFGDLKIFNETEMKEMTKNYSMAFRKSMCECLYNGVIGMNRPIIVRLLETSSETGREIFLNTMSILSQKNHKNVVNIVGFHIGKSSLECVYESCCDLSKTMLGSISLSNRNLYDTICSMKKLHLQQRLSIAVQCAEGLVHIHSLAAESPESCGTSLLGNFRSANIFLDENFVPKIFNVNLSTFLGLSGAQKHTVFSIHYNGPEKYYSDPRDVSGQLLNKKSDVYSFGVVLLELITWKTVRYMYNLRARVLTTDFLDSYRRDRDAIGMFGKVCDEHEGYFVHEALSIAIDCLQLDIQMRPEMEHVLFRLRIIVARSKLAAGSNNKPSQHIGRALVNNIDKLHPTLISTISMEELNEATGNFSNDVLIGQGPYAECFLGVLKDGQNLAVKRLRTSEEIQVEVPTILRMCYHDNVVQFLGCFLEGGTRVLAYEYAPRGSLHDILHGKMGIKGARPGPPLSWLQRVKIAVTLVFQYMMPIAGFIIGPSTILSGNI
ncbi:PTI1-like tyrosine-protein kinase 3 [Zea mays]|uniref:PTI1-like tyrosine-protein kinase 3 n=1 Tax=Zea mays TaxID=4577 RepID=A0A1D6J1M3_MAIZE|nr:PTI1-like tyrosine-protein kinase 3 [Zea mays]